MHGLGMVAKVYLVLIAGLGAMILASAYLPWDFRQTYSASLIQCFTGLIIALGGYATAFADLAWRRRSE
ncbi:hypothetical protein [Methylobrevis albus]|uniref:Uncharacterized protein n=1 Tax=Methylobrevis albus TaxID=2793297 RepID=A0A931HYU0_9HYPH|nr:hypothetical protein [Methylobrevis albus]MBH0237227.1 hypothetical protein [Methylobrevis albus]